ncbi:MAG TPA: isocitrate lyase/phosphoenolpyruvate mutase family protein [Desulfobacterales bacterium]|jgi:phosphonopyruvate hydrolase|nr:isocitrate lyase/phosphoenolpyruvate mutase family protein [Desulfobacterales bacterium]|tara:strand:+ start:413 stop:1285 length:873 start_codon:yes stop_codon:yes gene_type:complete
MNRASMLRELFDKKELVVIVGAHNGMGAKLVERAGFDAVWSSGLEISASYGIPDASLISMYQFVEAARSMNEVINIPVVADCDTGYGNAINVMYMIKRYEEAGIAGVVLEEKKFPKDNSLLDDGRQELLRVEEFEGKIESAKAAQKNPDFMVIARVEALIAGYGQEEAQMRAHRYADAGADAIFIHSKSKNPQEIIEFVNHWDIDVPLVLTPTIYSSLREQEIKELNKVKMVIYANHGMRAAIKAMETVFAKIKKDGGIYDIEEFLVPVKHVFDLQDVPRMKENENKFLR